jgi:hypothetical protein
MLIIGCDFHTRYQQIGGWRSPSLVFNCAGGAASGLGVAHSFAGRKGRGFSVHYLNSFHGQMFASRNDSPLPHWPSPHRML